MNKATKIVLGVLGGIVLLGGLGAWYASATIDPAQLAKLLSSSVKSATGRDLKIEGPISLSVFPKIAVRAERLSLSNASWAQASDMLTLKYIELNIKTLPLMSARVEIDNIELHGVNVYLQANAAGKVNWDLDDGAPASNTPADKVASSTDSGDSSFIGIEKLSLADAQIQYRNALNEESNYQVRRLSLERSGNKTALAFSGIYRDLSIDISGKTGLISELLKNWESATVQFPVDLNMVVNKKSLALKGNFKKDPKEDAVLDMMLSSKSFDWPTLASSQNKATSKAGITVSSAENKPVRKSSPYLFSNESLPFNSLPKLQGKISIDIAELGLPARKPIENLKANMILQGNAIDISHLTFQMGKGTADLQMKMANLDGPAPTVQLSGATKDFILESLLARLDPSSKVSGGNMKLALDLQLSGNSLHQMAANSTGKIQVSIDQAKMGSNFLNDAGDFVITVLDSMNPLRKKSSETVVECAVAYLPIHNGQMSIANTVGMETDRLNVVLAGSINLKNEAVNLTIDPKEKSGFTTGLDLAGLVKVGGTLSHPKAMINQAGVVNSAVSIGLGFLTGGASILAENARSLSSKSHPCRDALHPWADIYSGVQ